MHITTSQRTVKITRVDMTSQEVARKILEFQTDMMTELVQHNFRKHNIKRDVVVDFVLFAMKCLNGPNSVQFKELLQETDICWIDSPLSTMASYGDFVEDFPALVGLGEVLEMDHVKDDKDLEVFIDERKLDSQKILSNY